MFWIILILIQLVLWWVTFFKSKKMVRERGESRWNSTYWGEFQLTNERYKFPLGLVFLVFLACVIPLAGIVALIVLHINIMSRTDREWETTKPSLALVELLKKEI